MRAYVFTDPALRPVAGRFVWLAIDGEQARNAALTRRLNLVAYPTYYILDPVTERVALRWVGGMSVEQMEQVLASGETAVKGGGTPFDRAMVSADSLYAIDADSAATLAYQTLLARVPHDWPNRERVLESLLFAASQCGRDTDVVALATAELPGRPDGLALGNVAAAGLGSAVALAETDPRRAAAIARFRPVVERIAADSTLAMTGDDRSGMWITLLDAADAEHDSTAHRAVARAWAEGLERDARRARTPEQRSVYDAHRLSAYLELGEPERALPMLHETVREFPDDYNPHARLAIALNALHRYPEALAESDSALAMSYGPRRISFYRTRVDILVGMGDKPGARKALEDAIAMVQALPPGQRSEAAIASFQKRLAGLR